MHGYLKYHNRSFWRRSHKSSQLMIVIRNLVKLDKNYFLYGQFWGNEIKGKHEKLSLKFSLNLNAERINFFFDAWVPGLTNKKQKKNIIQLYVHWPVIVSYAIKSTWLNQNNRLCILEWFSGISSLQIPCHNTFSNHRRQRGYNGKALFNHRGQAHPFLPQDLLINQISLASILETRVPLVEKAP